MRSTTWTGPAADHRRARPPAPDGARHAAGRGPGLRRLVDRARGRGTVPRRAGRARRGPRRPGALATWAWTWRRAAPRRVGGLRRAAARDPAPHLSTTSAPWPRVGARPKARTCRPHGRGAAAARQPAGEGDHGPASYPLSLNALRTALQPDQQPRARRRLRRAGWSSRRPHAQGPGPRADRVVSHRPAHVEVPPDAGRAPRLAPTSGAADRAAAARAAGAGRAQPRTERSTTSATVPTSSDCLAGWRPPSAAGRASNRAARASRTTAGSTCSAWSRSRPGRAADPAATVTR